MYYDDYDDFYYHHYHYHFHYDNADYDYYYYYYSPIKTQIAKLSRFTFSNKTSVVQTSELVPGCVFGCRIRL